LPGRGLEPGHQFSRYQSAVLHLDVLCLGPLVDAACHPGPPCSLHIASHRILPGSACSVVIGEGLPLGEPGSVKGVQLVVEDLDAVRSELAARGVAISDV